jgi:uncharacterized protein (TIGR02757 family)
MTAFRNKKDLREFLERKVIEYNHSSFIAKDPVSVPHRFSRKQDIEISGLFAAIFSWGNRTTIIQKSNELMEAMDQSPYDFIRNHRPRDLIKLREFKHRTFNETDLLYFIRFLKFHYQQSDSLETAFILEDEYEGRENLRTETDHSNEEEFVKKALSVFYTRFFSLEDAPRRTQKHIASPEKNSTCKRLNMYLRWMVRRDKKGVDFGIWKKISPADLICPVDLHVARVARSFGLIRRTQTDWQTAMELTHALRAMDKDDPVKFDFALFGLGVTEKY